MNSSTYSKFAIKTTKLTFLMLTLSRFHTSCGGSGNFLFIFFSIKLYSQYLQSCIMHYLLRYYKEPDKASRGVL